MVEQQRFSFVWSRNGCSIKFDADVSIPLGDDQDVTELVAMLCAVNNVPPFAKDAVQEQLTDFILVETQNLYDRRGAADIERFVELSELELEDVVDQWVDHYSRHYKCLAPAKSVSAEQSFRSVYESLVNGECPGAIQKILSKEKALAVEVQKVVRARDWEVERLKREHANVIEQAVQELNSGPTADQQVSMAASRHFEKLHLVESNYASQLTSLMECQKREFRNFVLKLHEEQILRQQGASTPPIPDYHSASGQISPRQHQDSVTVGAAREESFTIYLGAQLKTMHNLRLTAVNGVELYRRKQLSGIVEDSQRLQTALGLYGNQLSALLLLVDSRPSFHLSFRSDFARACEQSTELHFRSLEEQLENIESCVIRANEWRANKTAESSSKSSDSASAGSGPKCPSETLSTGDIYVTKHSNLSQITVAFHMVYDEALKSQEVNSRHPCINGLRNIVRLCSKFGITTLSIPLLLIERMTEELTIAWCLKRAELVFKCVKGFLMEAAALGSCSDNNEMGRQQHYTVQFIVPPEISNDTYAQISEMLPAIFHSVRPVVAD